MKVRLRATIEREIEVNDACTGWLDDMILEDYVFSGDGLMADAAELMNGMTWEVVSRGNNAGGEKCKKS